MNFLAHAYIAGDDDPLFLLGNLMADFLRGRPDPGLPPRVIEGMLLHRKVDAFTDAHPIFIQSRDRLKPVWGRYSPILVDMFYDHFLAQDWERYSEEPLRLFADRVYAILLGQLDLMPEIMRRSIPRMIDHDWFASYATVDGLSLALQRLSKRFPPRREVHLEESARELLLFNQELRSDFHRFMPELIAFAARETNSKNQHAFNGQSQEAVLRLNP